MEKEKTIPDSIKEEIYNDAIKPVVKETGKALAILPRVIKNALNKVEMWCLNKEFLVKELELELEKKLQQRKEENIVDADSSIFIPSAQAISYNWDKESIRELYLNLMVADMDKTEKENVHPSYTEVIKQMDTTDVKIFTLIYNCTITPMYFLKKKNNTGSIVLVDYLLSDNYYKEFNIEKVIKSLNNLERLKLLEITDDKYYTLDDNYLPIENGQILKEYREVYGDSLKIVKGLVEKTVFGKDFYKICCQDNIKE